MPTTINDLPLELLPHIMDHLIMSVDAKTLLAASLVCRHWRVPAQMSLWEDISLDDSPTSIDRILASPAIGYYRTRSLSVSFKLTRVTSPSAKELLATLVDLRNLHLMNDAKGRLAVGPGTFGDDSWLSRGYLRGTSSCGTFCCVGVVNENNALEPTGLKLLVLNFDFVPSASATPIAIPAFNLSSLLIGGALRAGSRRIVQSILTSSMLSLKTLYLHEISDDIYPTLINTLPSVGNTLVTLTIYTSGLRPTVGYAVFTSRTLASLVALKNFTISAENLVTICMALDRLPASVIWIKVVIDLRMGCRGARAVLAAMEEATWKALKVLDFVESRDEILKMDQGPELLQRCAQRTIAVRFRLRQ